MQAREQPPINLKSPGPLILLFKIMFVYQLVFLPSMFS